MPTPLGALPLSLNIFPPPQRPLFAVGQRVLRRPTLLRVSRRVEAPARDSGSVRSPPQASPGPTPGADIFKDSLILGPTRITTYKDDYDANELEELRRKQQTYRKQLEELLEELLEEPRRL